MAKRLMMTLGIVIAAILLGVGLSLMAAGRTAKELSPPATLSSEQTADAPKSPAPQAEKPAPGAAADETGSSGYLLRAYEGRIAVFREGSTTPDLIFDVYTRMLPQPDQAALEVGILVQDYEELTRLIEDYIS